MIGDIKLFSGTSNRQLATSVACELGMQLENCDVERFSDGEIRIELQNNVRGCRAFVIQPTCAPTNDSIMELILMTDALRRSSALEVIAVIPYYGYARQDRRSGYSRVPISARAIATMLEAAGVDHVITVDLHATQIQGFFNIPVDNISASNLFIQDISHKWMDERPIIVSPDVGGVARARQVAKHLNDMDLAIVDKRRPKANVSEVMNIIGDVKDRTCIIIDDMVDTAGTLGKAANALIGVGGARRVVAYATHGVLSGSAAANLDASLLEQLVVTDSIPASTTPVSNKVQRLSLASTLAETITRVATGGSVRAFLD